MIEKYLLGVTGEIGCGKSHGCKSLIHAGHLQGINVSYLPCDDIGKIILLTNIPEYKKARQGIAEKFGSHLIKSDTSLDKDRLRDTILEPKTGSIEENKARLNEYNTHMAPFFSHYIDNQINKTKDGLILLETAILAELNAFQKVDYNTLLFYVSKERQFERLKARETKGEMSLEDSLARKSKQYSFAQKAYASQKAISNANKGSLYIFNTSFNPPQEEYNILFNQITRTNS